MIWSEDFCFVHYPKTAGKTLTQFFVKAWDAPVSGFVSPGQINELKDCELEKHAIEVGRGHENLEEAAQLIGEAGRDLLKMRAIFCCIRNPYDLMVSNYHFMRQTYKHNTHRPNFVVAHENNFTDFCEKVGAATPAKWMELDGEQPANLEIIRFESMADDLNRLAEKYAFDAPPLAHLNASKRAHYSEYMNPRAEAAVFKKFRYWFDLGYYPRESFDADGADQAAA